MSGFWENGGPKPPADEIDADDAPLELATPPSAALARADAGWLADLVQLASKLPPRDLPAIRAEAERIGTELGRILDTSPDSQGCAAFYRWEQGGQVIEGPTIDLMEALEGAFGRIVSEVELTSETPDRGRGSRVTFTVRCVDLENLVIKRRPFVATLAPAPGKFANKPDQRERWATIQLQSALSKGERSIAERVIPRDVVETAMNAARTAAAAERMGAKTLGEGISKALDAFARLQPAPSIELLERWVGRPRAEWNGYDLQALRGPFARLRNGETAPDEFIRETDEREAVRLAAPPPTPARDAVEGDRLSGLGLGKAPAAAAPTTSAPAPATELRSAPGASGGTSSPPEDKGARAKATEERRTAALTRLEQLRREYPDLVGQVSIEVAGAPVTQRTALHKVEDVLRHADQAIALARETAASKARPPLPDVLPDPKAATWEGPTGAELRAEVQALAIDLGPKETASALLDAGQPAIDGAGEEALRAIFVAMLARIPEPGSAG